MKLEINLPTFKMPEFKGFTNPLTKEGIRALAIVLGMIVIISAVVYSANLGKRRESTVLPAKTWEEAAVTPQPIITPLTEEETSPASPSVEEVTVTPAPTE